MSKTDKKNKYISGSAPTLESPRVMRLPKLNELVGIMFIVILVMVFAVNFVIKDRKYSASENRVFQTAPNFSLPAYFSGRFESKLDDYANDQFMARDLFIKIKSASDVTLGALEANGVYRAGNEYLMEDVAIPDEAGRKADLEALKAFRKKYSKKKMYFLLAPTSANILSEKLPLTVETADQNAEIDGFFGSIKRFGYNVIDVRKELGNAAHNVGTQVYYRTDHHWTTDGAYIAYKKAAKEMKLTSKIKYKPVAVKKDFTGTLTSKSGFTNGRNDAIKLYLPNDKKYKNSVIFYTDTKEKTTNYYELENLNKKDAYTVFGGTNHSLYTITTPTKSRKNLLVIKDSYANSFIPFLTQDYRSITVVDPRYYYENIATVMKANDVDEILFLYNANTFFTDNYLRMMLTNK